MHDPAVVFDTFESPVYMVKNRYCDILPCMHFLSPFPFAPPLFLICNPLSLLVSEGYLVFLLVISPKNLHLVIPIVSLSLFFPFRSFFFLSQPFSILLWTLGMVEPSSTFDCSFARRLWLRRSGSLHKCMLHPSMSFFSLSRSLYLSCIYSHCLMLIAIRTKERYKFIFFFVMREKVNGGLHCIRDEIFFLLECVSLLALV